MRIVSRKRLREYATRNPAARASLTRWERIARGARWATPADLVRTFRRVDPVVVASGNTVHVFDIQHNAHRLIATIHFDRRTVYVLRILTHREYDRRRWVEEL